MSAAAPDADARRIRQRQLLLFSSLAAVLLGVFAVWMGAGGGGKAPTVTGIEAELAGPGSAEDSWTRRSEARIGDIESRVRGMESEARRLTDENAGLRDRLVRDAANARAVIDTHAATIAELERRLGAAPGAGGDGPFLPAGPNPSAAVPAAEPVLPAAPAPMIERFDLEGDAGGETGAVPDAIGPGAKALGTWLPAGAHAEAVVLAGVDASAGLASQGDPRPVLLRITGPAWTAAGDGAAMSVDLEGCTVTGAAHGDLSSEKVYARLRTLTCAGRDPDTVVETQVAGFVAGTGKTGVRGPVVSREGALVEKAFLAGLVSGVGQGVQAAFSPQAVATGAGTAAVSNTGLGDIGRAGLGAGASTAGQKVADYMIRRAEQYQPVIQLHAGTRVTVVFLEGTRLDGRRPAPPDSQETPR